MNIPLRTHYGIYFKWKQKSLSIREDIEMFL